MYFLELQVRVSGAGACNIEDEWVSSELDEDDSSLTTSTVSSQLKLSDILSYAHRISYTTFAPPES